MHHNTISKSIMRGSCGLQDDESSTSVGILMIHRSYASLMKEASFPLVCESASTLK